MNNEEATDMTDEEYQELIRATNIMLAAEPMDDVKVGRNEPCPCGSGKKYKKCCLDKPEPLAINPEPVDQSVSPGVFKSVLPVHLGLVGLGVSTERKFKQK